RACDRLSKAEQQRQVAMYALPLELFRGADAFPSACQLDENPLWRNAGLLVQRNQLLRFGKAAFLVERQTCIDLGGNSAFDMLQDLAAKVHCKLVHYQINLGFSVSACAHACREGIFNQSAISWVLRRLKKQ